MSTSRTPITDAEWQVRQDLAAAYQLAALHRMTDHIYTHISARVPDEEGHFLLNAYGLTFNEVTASNLVKVDLTGKVLSDTTGLGINLAGFIIHGAIHEHRHDAFCVMHTHTQAGIAVSAQRRGLRMLSQHAMRFHHKIAYHDYEGVVLDMDERDHILQNLGTLNVMILRNHGLLVCGDNIPDAFDQMYYLERACQIQIAAQSSGEELIESSDTVASRVAAQFDRPGRPSKDKHWPPLLRMLDRVKPEYKR
ncbi:class II aldolase/adducin family protein [Diaphorobacter sp. HDW4A]|uniref:class II aldolase/adducin family protein n=1 Tax=Diaphorobacter sp. HDW4A TaxID=2714924 RepID=UPI00140D82F3|nr:class II aldolase/adducin family protein [Diaphorobacter sp. HDW4A]QIL82725.1 class II aldolase/adducin family protein [Diaphorobacter sp. HDW4A]